jgi:uncharacterized RDD family membrane protein YckC
VTDPYDPTEPPKPPPPPPGPYQGENFGAPPSEDRSSQRRASGPASPSGIPTYGPIPTMPQHQVRLSDGDGWYQNHELAEFGRRGVSWAIDWFLPYVLFLFASSIQSSAGGVNGALGRFWGGLLQLLVLAAFIGNLVVLQGRTGQSVGKRAMGTRLAAMSRLDEPPGYGLAFGHTLASFLNFIPCGLGWFWAIWDRRNQTWGDKIASAVVVRNE